MGDFEGEGGSLVPRPCLEAYQELDNIIEKAGKSFRELLSKTAKELFGNDFPKMNFCVQYGGNTGVVSLCGIVVHEPRETDKNRVFVLMLPDGLYGLYMAGGNCKDGNGNFRTDLLRPMSLWQYSEFVRNAVAALQIAYEEKQGKKIQQRAKGICTGVTMLE